MLVYTIGEDGSKIEELPTTTLLELIIALEEDLNRLEQHLRKMHGEVQQRTEFEVE